MLIQISLRSPNGQSRIQIEDGATLRELVELIKTKTELSSFTLKYGYPLKPLDISSSSQDKSILDLKLRGETIVVAPTDTAPPPPSQPAPAEPTPKPFTPKGIEPDGTSLEWPERGGYIVTAFGGAIGLENPSRTLRNQVADYILNHPNEYSKAILGDEPQRYTTRMRQMDTWGGAIELSILSDIYNLEISSIDSLRVDRFGEGKSNRVIILYSGIHYDRIAFCMDLSYPVEVDVTRWATDDNEVLDKARQLAKRLQSLHYYTDTTDFVIKCEVCNWIGQGTRGAAKHERETGHSQFGELQITD
ncbi:hypothetical protein NEMBOFW57_010538 [Staphylotrichum longicolle]|uniref:Ubiquitin thioesterase OTU n=1 Tax=Staphylotrichum longicolle TaxID=669026 RepID=A0AAD4HUW2_9PEZI|nr:hypothetical protein NEMBOFW57_010538 [Staphylotrichum longicolle]